MRPVVVRPPEKARPAPGAAPEPAPSEPAGGKRKRLIRIAGAANDNVPSWAMRLGRMIVLGIVAALVVAGAVMALV